MANQMDKSYTELCSERTIFSDDQGFFGEMLATIKKSCSEKWLKNLFESKISDATKIKLLFDEPDVSDMLLGTLEHVQSVYRPKECTFSHERRKQGEILHRKGELNNALVLLTQAILRAPSKGIDIRYDGGLSLALALWSRSAVLLDLNRGDDALADIQCAIDNGLDNVKKKLDYYVRIAKANAMVGDLNKTKICLNLVKRICGEGIQLDQIQNEVKLIRANGPIAKIQVPKLGANEHKHLHNASSKLELRSSADSGNYVVANEEIKAGETIVVEKPIAACLLPQYFGSHCLHCLRRIKIAYGCPNCSGIAYCSIDCQKQACSTYHQYECKYMDIMIGSGMSILCFVALRMITQQSSVDAAIQNGRQVIRELCSHSTKRPASDYLQRTVMSAFLLRILQKANFFGRRPTESAYPSSEAEFQIGEILIGLLQVLQFNAHEIYETKAFESQNQVDGKQLIYVGAAIYNSAVYFNHSCYPDVIRYFVGTTIVLCASHPLRSGDMIAENYGPIFTRHPLPFRQRNLQSRYWFKCTCQPCHENWLILDKLTNKVRLRCANSKCNHLFKCIENSKKLLKCPKCNGTTNLEIQIATLRKAEDLYRAAAEYMDENRLKEAAKTFIDGINLFYTVAVPPHRDTHIAQESLRVCLSNIGRS